MKVLSSRITTEEPADIRDLLMAFQETPHDEDSSSSDVWPEDRKETPEERYVTRYLRIFTSLRISTWNLE
jgi:hypothetical protein